MDGDAHAPDDRRACLAREILKTRDQLNKILAERTGQPLEKIERDTERDYYLSAAESAEYGLIDKVIDKRPGAV